MKEIALSACRTAEEKAEIKDMTIAKLEDMGLLCMLGREYAPTHAFNLMTVNRMKHAKIQCALFKGTERDIFIDRKEFKGSIYEQIEGAYQFVKRHINLSVEIEGIVRRDIYELPMRAVREAIINGVTRRSYMDGSCMQISIYNDRIEVYSPGMLFGRLDLSEALRGKSKCRNAAISEAFHNMKIIETWGTSLGRIRHSCMEYGLPEPVIEESGDGFRVIFYRKMLRTDQKISSNEALTISTDHKMGSKTEIVGSTDQNADNAFAKYKTLLVDTGITKIYISNIERIYKYVGQTVFRQSDVMEYLGCSKSKAGNIINAMKQAGVIRKVTGMGLGRYQFV